MPKVWDIAHCRAGDKGDTSNISVIAYDEAGWKVIREQLTVDRVQAAFAHIAKGPVRRYELPKLQALNFVIEGALGGGVTRALAQDPHGKSLSSLMLTIELPEKGAARDITSPASTSGHRRSARSSAVRRPPSSICTSRRATTRPSRWPSWKAPRSSSPGGPR